MDVLTNKQYKSYDMLSRYTRFPYYYHSVDNKYIYGMSAQLRDDTMYIYHKVRQGDTPDSLSLAYYNNPTYYWVILDFNRIQDPFADLPVGELIKIPTLSAINFNI